MKIPVNGPRPESDIPKRARCGGRCSVCRSSDLTIERLYRETIIYGLGVETVRYLQYMARMTMLVYGNLSDEVGG